MAYTQEQIDKALETVLGQGASYEDVVGAAGQYGLSQADVDAAYSRRTPASVSEPLDLSRPADIAAQNAVTAEQNAAAASDLINKEYWAWNDPRYAPEDSPGQYGLEQYWDQLLKTTGFDMSKATRPVFETVEVPVYDDSGYQIGTRSVTRPQMTSSGESGMEYALEERTPEYYKAIDALRAAGYDVRARNPDADTYNTYYGIIGPGGKVLQDIKVKGGNASGWEDFGNDLVEALVTLGPIALQFFPVAGQALGSAILGAGANATAATALGNAIIQGGLTGLKGGDLSDVLKSGAIAGVGSLASPYIKQLGGVASEAVGGDTFGKIASGAVTGAAKSGLGALLSGKSIEDALRSGGVRGLVGAGTGTLQGAISDYLKSDVTAEGLEDLFGGLGVDETVSAEQYVEPVAAFPEDFGYVPEQTLPAIESDYSVAQTPTGPRIVDAAGNLGDFDSSGRFVTDTEFMGPSISTKDIATAPNEKINVVHPLPKKDIFIPDWDRQDVINPDWDILPLPMEEPDRTPGRPEDTSPGGGTTGREDEVFAPAPAPAPAPSPVPAPIPAPTPTPAPQADSGIAGITPQQWAVLNAILAGKMGAAYDPYLLGKAARERKEKEASLNELMAALGFNQQA